MPTITFAIVDDAPVDLIIDNRPIPIRVGTDHGAAVTARTMTQRRLTDPAACDHAGAGWSANFALHCPRCGSPLFLPPHLLAHLPASTITAMELLWSAAGWPEWRPDGGLNVSPDGWSIYPHPLFAPCGGLAVRNAMNWRYLDAVEELER